MVGSNPAIGILYDVVVTLQGTSNGDDGNPTRSVTGSAITVKFDKVTLQNNRSLADHGTAQDEAEFNRITKLPQVATFETKLQKKTAAELFTLLQASSGVIVKFTITATGASTTGSNYGIVEGFEWEYAGPSTLKFTLRQYGSVWTFNTGS